MHKTSKNKPVLWVKAKEHSAIREIDEFGKPFMSMRFVGYDDKMEIIQEGVKLPYMVHYISQLKQGTLLALDIATARLAGVSLHIPEASLVLKVQ